MRNEAGEEDELPPIILVLSSLCKEAIDTSFRYAGDITSLCTPYQHMTILFFDGVSGPQCFFWWEFPEIMGSTLISHL